jgi:hypothetical protein
MKVGLSQDILDPSQKIGEGVVYVTTGAAIEQFAEAIHSNPETVRQALWIEEHAPEKIPELERGASISKVYREIKHEENVKELEKKLPTEPTHENLTPLFRATYV